MKPIICLSCFLLLLAAGCRPLSLDRSAQKATLHQVPLGGVGSGKVFLLQTGFHGAAVPNYKEPIKIAAATVPFTKQAYRRFLKAKAAQSGDADVAFVDSLATKPQFVQLMITDRIALIDALNEQGNHAVKDYMGQDAQTNIVTEISIVFDQADLDRLQGADAVFLIESSFKTYSLQLYKKGVKTETVPFNNGVVFAYKASSCCWQENSRRQLDIVDLVGEYDNCPKKTYRTANRAKKKVNYFKL